MMGTVVKPRWLVMPLVAIFLLFSTGAAAATDCHIESSINTNGTSVPTHNHSGLDHKHSHLSASAAASGAQSLNVLADKALENEICFVIGFIVLLLFRFLQHKRVNYTEEKISLPRFILQPFVSKNLGYLNLTHLKLGIIRI
jgi:hypothetical protein